MLAVVSPLLRDAAPGQRAATVVATAMAGALLVGSGGWDHRRRKPLRAEEHVPASAACLPRWLAAAARHAPIGDSSPWPAAHPVVDPSRKEKMSMYEEAQRSPVVAAANLALRRPPLQRDGEGRQRSLRLVCFNLHFMRDSFMRDNRQRVLQALAELDADIVAFQEVALPGPEAIAGAVDDRGGSSQGSSTSGIDEEMRAWWSSMERDLGLSSQGAGSGGRTGEGDALLGGMRALGYAHAVFTPNCFFASQCGGFCGNAVFSRLPPVQGLPGSNRGIVLDKKRHKEDRCAALLTVNVGENVSVTIASAHLDVWAERGHFGLAEGELVRLLEFEELHHATQSLPNVLVAGDFNAASRLCAESSELHGRLMRATEECTMSRSAVACRHSLPRASPRLPDDWALSVLGFAEQRLGYRHCWQSVRPDERLAPPLYSHWSGQLIDHCLLAPAAQRALRVTGVGVYHTDASDHLPLVVDMAVA